MGWAGLGWLAVALVGALGCSRRDAVPLLDVTGLVASLADSGEFLEVSGLGFPGGRDGELTLRGRLETPGRATRFSMTLAATATGFDRAEAWLPSEGMPSLAAPARFEGSAELRFPGRNGVWVSGTLDGVALELGGDRPPLRSEAAGAPRAAAGRSVDGQSEAQVDAATNAPSAEGASARVADPSGRWVWLLAVCPGLLALWFFGPWHSPLALVRRAHERLASRPIVLFCVAARGGGSEQRVWLVWASLAAGAVGLVGAAGCTVWAALGVYALLLGVRFREDRAGWQSRVGHLTVLGVALGCVALASGSSSLSAIAADQGHAPWGWNLVARPPLALAGWLALRAGVALHPQSAPSARLEYVDGVGRVVLALLLATLFLGGGALEWPLGAAWGPSAQSGVRSALLAAKGWFVLCALASVRALGSRESLSGSARWTGALVLASLGFIALQPSRELEERIGESVALTLGLGLAIAAILRSLELRRPAGRKPLAEGGRAATASTSRR